MDRATLLELIARGEGTQIEFKLRAPTTLRLARSVSAFANSMGGTIILGVDDHGAIVGVDATDSAMQALHDCLDLIRPQPHIEVQSITLDGLHIVAGMVSKGMEKPYRVNSDRGEITYIRAGASVRPASKGFRLDDEDNLRRRIRMQPLQKAVMETIRKEEGIRIGVLSARHNLSKTRTLKLLVPLLKAGMVVEKDGGYMLR